MIDIQEVKVSPDPYEPYRLAQAHRVGDLVYVSGQAAVAPDGSLVVGDFDRQADQVFTNLERVLEAAGSSLGNVVKVTIFITDMGNFDKVVAHRGKWFTPPYPADTIVEVRSLYSPDAMIEIEAIAVIDSAAHWTTASRT